MDAPRTTQRSGQQRGVECRARILAFWREYVARERRDPTWRELCRGTGIASNGQLAHHIHRLIAAGLIVHKGGARGYQLVERPECPS